MSGPDRTAEQYTAAIIDALESNPHARSFYFGGIVRGIGDRPGWIILAHDFGYGLRDWGLTDSAAYADMLYSGVQHVLQSMLRSVQFTRDQFRDEVQRGLVR
jgi:hypothetical protein